MHRIVPVLSITGPVHRVGDELWMWYLAQGDDDSWHHRVCFAKSRDGYNWEKPELGFVEYNGSNPQQPRGYSRWTISYSGVCGVL